MSSVQSMVVAGAFVVLFAMLAALLIRSRPKVGRKVSRAASGKPWDYEGSWPARSVQPPMGMPMPIPSALQYFIPPQPDPEMMLAIQALRRELRAPSGGGVASLEDIATMQLLIARAVAFPLKPQQLRACEIICEVGSCGVAADGERYQRAAQALNDPSASPAWSDAPAMPNDVGELPKPLTGVKKEDR